MPKYLALIKSNQLKKLPNWSNQLHAAFEYLGFTNVRVNKASGCVYFEYWMKSVKALAWHIQRIIKEKLGLSSQVTVKSATNLHP